MVHVQVPSKKQICNLPLSCQICFKCRPTDWFSESELRLLVAVFFFNFHHEFSLYVKENAPKTSKINKINKKSHLLTEFTSDNCAAVTSALKCRSTLPVSVTDSQYVNENLFLHFFLFNLFVSSSQKMQKTKNKTKNKTQSVTHCVLRVSRREPAGRQPEGHHGRGSLSQEALSSPRGSRRCGEKTKPAELPQKEVRDRTAAPPKKEKRSEKKKKKQKNPKPPHGRHVWRALPACFDSV